MKGVPIGIEVFHLILRPTDTGILLIAKGDDQTSIALSFNTATVAAMAFDECLVAFDFALATG